MSRTNAGRYSVGRFLVTIFLVNHSHKVPLLIFANKALIDSVVLANKEKLLLNETLVWITDKYVRSEVWNRVLILFGFRYYLFFPFNFILLLFHYLLNPRCLSNLLSNPGFWCVIPSKNIKTNVKRLYNQGNTIQY